MPEKLEKCVKDVISQGKDKDSAWPICIDSTGEKPHKESVNDSMIDSMMKQVLETKLKGCGCQKKTHS